MTVSGKTVAVSRRELALLASLVAHEGSVVSREDLYRAAWGQELRDGDRSVDVYVHKLRRKIEAVAPSEQLIHTHFGFGYRLEAGSRDVHITDTRP